MRNPRFNSFLARGFELVFDRVKSLFLASVQYRISNGLSRRLPSGRPVLLFGNHVSNWDGFLYRDLQKKIRPGVPIYSLMLEKEIKRLPVFRGLGGVGIDPASHTSTARALRLTQKLRSREDDFFFTVFPQGSTYPSSKRPLGFQEGVRAFARALGSVTLLPVGLHFELLGSLRPHAFVVVGEPIVFEDAEVPPLEVLESHVTALLDDLQKDLSIHGELAVRSSQGSKVGERE